MPSYRREQPQGASGRFSPTSRRGEPQEGPRRPEPEYRDVSRRGTGKKWVDIIVPESEQEDPFFNYGDVFSIFSPRSGRRPAPRETPREGPREAHRAAEAPRTEERVNPSNWFDLRRIWAAADAVRRDPRFRKESRAAVVRIAGPARNDVERAKELIAFFGVPPDEVRRYSEQDLWKGLLEPFLQALERAINAERPPELPGRFYFQKGVDGSYWLAYAE